MAVIRVSALYTYPIKSCAGIQHDKVELTARGPLHDREWMIVGSDGVFITQREIPQLALITPMLDGGGLTVNTPGMPTLRVQKVNRTNARRQVTVWKDTCEAEDAGDEAAHWLSQYLGIGARLVRLVDDFRRPTSAQYTDRPGEVSFADGYPLLFVSKGSLADLNERLVARGKVPVPMNRFRPNVVISGCNPYAEDGWKHVAIGGIRFEVVKPCARCVITTVDQAAGKAPDVREPLATLATYQRGANGGAMFGQNVIHRGLGTLRVGDAVDTF